MKRAATVAVAASLGLTLAFVQPGMSDGPGFENESTLIAQVGGKKASSGTSSTTKAKKPRGRLPDNYGKLGLRDDQRENIYKIQAKYAPQIEELEKQIEALEAKEDAEINTVLTDAQKKYLAEILAEKKKKSSSKSGGSTRSSGSTKKKADE